MKRQEEAICLRIFIGETDRYGGKPLYLYLLEAFKKADLAGATVTRGIAGFGKNSRIQTSSILQLSTDLPIMIEVVDRKEKIDAIKPIIDQSVKEGLVTEEPVTIYLYGSTLDKIDKA
ncbi:MAG: DUF190 domain-containing protein [Candidatus Atribacteria bacterium]|jgi:hypothetical protein|nr:DUF190 domain-containing protein [Candidatus Atribacteria bacterium]